MKLSRSKIVNFIGLEELGLHWYSASDFRLDTIAPSLSLYIVGVRPRLIVGAILKISPNHYTRHRHGVGHKWVWLTPFNITRPKRNPLKKLIKFICYTIHDNWSILKHKTSENNKSRANEIKQSKGQMTNNSDKIISLFYINVISTQNLAELPKLLPYLCVIWHVNIHLK